MNAVKHHAILAAALSLAWVASAEANPQLALEHGCYSCHGANLRGEAPSFERLAGKLAKYRGDAAAQARLVTEYRAGEPFGHIDLHERVSLQTATALVKWLAEGGQ